MNEQFINKKELKKTVLEIKDETEDSETEFAKGWRNALARLFYECKL